MSDTNDTVDGLLAEFRGYAAGMPPSYHVTMSWHDFNRMLDRFDAARKRDCAKIEADALAVGGIVAATDAKSSAVGNAAKLREALKNMAKELGDLAESDGIKAPAYSSIFSIFAEKCRTALASPPRNCDRFATVEDARKAHGAICEKYSKCHNGCPLNNEEHYSAFDCFEAWLFAPVAEQEGGADV